MIRFFFIFSFFVSIFLAHPVTVSADVLCRTDFDCPTDFQYTCEKVGTRAGGMGVCESPRVVNDTNGSNLFDNPLNAKSLPELLMTVLRGIVRVLALLLVPAFVYVGFKFAAARGNTEELSKARAALMWTVIGAAILLGAEGIAGVIEATARSLAP